MCCGNMGGVGGAGAEEEVLTVLLVEGGDVAGK